MSQADVVSELRLKNHETLFFVSYHKGAAASEALLIIDAICSALHLPQERAFVDTNNLSDLNKLLDHVRSTRVVVLIQTSQVLHRPFVLGELATAIEHDIPIVALKLKDKGYSFEESSTFLRSKDFRAALETQNPGSVEVLERNGIDLEATGQKLNEVIPNLISLELDLGARPNVRAAMIAEAADEIVKAASAAKKRTGIIIREFQVAVDKSDCEKVVQLLEERNICHHFLDISTRSTAFCDICRRYFSEGEKHGLCSECNFDICDSCSKTKAEDTVRFFDAILRLVKQNEKNRIKFGGFGACTVIPNRLRYVDSKDQAEKALDAIASLVGNNVSSANTANANDFVKARALQRIIRMVERHAYLDEEFAPKVCFTLELLGQATVGYRYDSSGAAGVDQVVDYLGNMLKTWSTAEDKIAKAVIRCLIPFLPRFEPGRFTPYVGIVVETIGKLAKTDKEIALAGCALFGLRDFPTDRDVPRIITDILVSWGKMDAEIASLALKAIEKWMLANEGFGSIFEKNGVIDAVVASATTFDTDLNVAVDACSAIAALIPRSDPSSSINIKFGSSGLPSLLAMLISRFGKHENAFIKAVCNAIAFLCLNTANRQKMDAANVPKLLLEVLGEWGSDSSVGAYAIINLAADKAIATKMLEEGKVESLISTWKDPRTRYSALRALGIDAQPPPSGCCSVS